MELMCHTMRCMWRGGDNDGVGGTVVWRKVESLIGMCRAADIIVLLEHVFRNNRKRCCGICGYRYSLSQRIDSTVLLMY